MKSPKLNQLNTQLFKLEKGQYKKNLTQVEEGNNKGKNSNH